MLHVSSHADKLS